MPVRAWWGAAVCLAGVLVVTGVDFSVSGRALFGDLLALIGGVFAASYVTAGSQIRRSLSTSTYTLISYGTCAVLLGAVAVAGRLPLAG